MTRRRKWILIGLGLGLSLLATGWFVWGVQLGAEYERRVDLLRKSGEYAEKPDPWNERIPDQANMAGPLSKAAAKLKALKSDEDVSGILALFSSLGWDYEGYGDEDFERLRKQWPKLKPYFAHVSAAGEKPHFAPPPLLENQESESWCGIQDVAELLQLRARLDPATAPGGVQLLLDLGDRWKPDSAIASRVRFTVRFKGLEIMRAALGEGKLDSSGFREAWDKQLAAVDPVANLRDTLRLLRMEQIRDFERLARGEDVYSEIRENYEKTRRELDSELRKQMPELPGPPWWSSWYARPVLYRKGLAMLADRERGLQYAVDEVAIRRALKNPELAKAEVRQYTHTLENIAVLRLARLALMIEASARKDGGAQASLDDYAGTWGGPVPRNPFTGEPFSYERHEDKAVIRWEDAHDAHADIEKHLNWDELRVWVVRWKPAAPK